MAAVDYSPFAGEMRERIAIQQEVDHPVGDGGGGQPGWTTITTVWASVTPVSSNIRIQTMDQALQVTHRIWARYLDYLAVPGAARYRVLWRKADMRILGVTNPDALKRYIEIMAVFGQMVGT
jgi:SPP1 family predicted phage head-tail adaptor